MVTIETKAAGARHALLPNRQIPLPGDSSTSAAPLTLRDLISRVVREEVASYHDRQERSRFVRVLTEREIRDGQERGKIDAAGRDEPVQTVDVESAIGTALQGFEDGLYFVLIDRQQYERLDEQVMLRPQSTVTFLRLVPLAGG